MQINNPYQQPAMNYNPGYAAYQYNPMANMQRYQQSDTQIQQQIPQFQQQQQVIGINGKIVAAVENITANDVPMDGSVAFFPKQDLSEIYVKGWNADGTIRTIVYKPYTEPSNNTTVNSMGGTEKSKFDLSEESTEVLMNRFDSLENRLSEIEQFMTTKTSAKSTDKSKNSPKQDGGGEDE